MRRFGSNAMPAYRLRSRGEGTGTRVPRCSERGGSRGAGGPTGATASTGASRLAAVQCGTSTSIGSGTCGTWNACGTEAGAVASSFAHLDVRSCFSLKEGAFTPEQLVARAAELGMPAVALTDRDGLYG